MKKKVVAVLVLVLALSPVFFAGCAKKATIKEAAPVTTDQSIKKPAAEAAKAPEAVPEEKITKQQPLKESGVATAKKSEAEVAKLQLFDLIHFGYDKYDLTTESRSILAKVADFLKNNPKYILRIEGHCDERGTAEYNMALGQRRADEAKKYLVKLGIDDGRISTLSYGEELPLDPAQTEEAWSKNRRDNFVPIMTK